MIKWKDIAGYEGVYAISSEGQVWSYPKLGKPGRLRKIAIDGEGYKFIALQHNKVRTQPKLHRLLAEAFIPNPGHYPCVNHKDGVKLNNSLDNLEWCTYSYNIKHSFELGLSNQIGSRNAYSKLNENDVVQIKQLVRSGRTQKSVAEEFSISRAVVNGILKGVIWTHVR